MPLYTYRREDGTTFDYRQKFLDEPLKVDPVTGQHVVRVVQAAGIIFKGSGFYVNDSKSGSRNSATTPPKHKEGEAAKSEATTTTATAESKTETAPATKTETKSETKTAAAD
jgi:predicted nucleic acid-binding Zn ribbon protein